MPTLVLVCQNNMEKYGRNNKKPFYQKVNGMRSLRVFKRFQETKVPVLQ